MNIRTPTIISAASTLAILAAGALLSCQSAEKTPMLDRLPYIQEPVLWDPSDRPVISPLASRESASSMSTPTELVSRARIEGSRASVEGVSTTVLTNEPGQLIDVKLTTRGADAVEVLRTIIAGYLERDSLIDPKINTQITMDVEQEMTPTEIMDMLGAICAVHGWVLEERGDLIVVRPVDQMPKIDSTPILQARAALNTDQPAIRIRTLSYIAPAEADKVLQAIMSAGSKIVMTGRTLVLIDTMAQLNRASQLLAALDVAEFDGVEIWTFRLGYRAPEDAASLLTSITTATSINSGSNPLVAFVPVAGTDRLLVISRDPTVLSMVRTFVDQVDQAPDRTMRSRYLYRIQHYDPAALKALLEHTFEDRMALTGQNASENGIRLTLDPTQNLLIVRATPYDYEDILATIKAVDIPPQQVQIEIAILEVALTDALQYGVEYFLQALNQDGIGILELAGATTMPVNPTGSAFFVGGDGLAVITALQNESEVEILAMPQLFLEDEAVGEFQVGGDVPIVTQDIDSDQQTDGTTGIRRSIEYRPTGIILQVQPSINESGQVTLDITLEQTDVGAQTDLGPEFTTRMIKSIVTVPHGNTLVLGGIIERGRRKSVEKIPILGDIPIVGAAFQSVDDRTERRELLLTATPTIISNPLNASRGSSIFLRRIEGVRAALDRLTNEDIVGPYLAIPGYAAPRAQPGPQDRSVDPLLPPELPADIRRLLEKSMDQAPQPTEPDPVMPPNPKF